MIKTKRFFVLGVAALLGVTALTGCSKAVDKAQNKVDKVALNALNQSQIVREVTDADFKSFSFLGADFMRDENDLLNVEVSGIAKYNESQNAFVNLNYEDVGGNFKGIDSEDKAKVISAISSVIKNKEIKEFEFTPISSQKVVNDTLENIAQSPISSYKFNKGVAFSVGNVDYNHEEGYVSFEVKSNIDYKETKLVPTYGITSYINGKPQYGMITRTQVNHKDYFHTHKVYVKASKDEMEAMMEDKSLIFDKFYIVVKNNEKDEYAVESLNVQDAMEYNISTLENYM